LKNDKETIIDALTYRRIISHLKQASKDGRRREQMRCKIALRNIARFRAEEEKALKDWGKYG
jgi:hypothetical protein